MGWARMQPAGQSGRGTAGGCLNGCAFQSPVPSSPRSSAASPSLMRCTPDSSGCAVQCFGQYDTSRTCAAFHPFVSDRRQKPATCAAFPPFRQWPRQHVPHSSLLTVAARQHAPHSSLLSMAAAKTRQHAPHEQC